MKLPTVLTAAALGLAGCRSYTPSPVDWEAEIAGGVTGAVRLAAPADAAALALVGNRALNTRRLKAARTAAAAREAGWWEDPELDADLMRILNPGDNPFLGGVSLAFTLPLSGVHKKEALAAEAYAAADAAEIRAAERTLAVDARQSALRLAALRQRAALLDDHENDARVKRARANVDALHAAGEITATARAAVRRAAHARHHAALEAERAAAEEEIVLLDLLGLRPGTAVTLAFPLPEPPAAPPPADDVRALTRHPKVEAALARLNGTEAALEAEIRRQYPELKLGPAYANEEGLDRLGLVAGVTLPLWNRNRKGIAEAEGERDEARRTAVDVWRSLVCEAASARAALATLLKHPPEPASARADADVLADAGELTPLDYLNVREEILDAHLAEADWRRDVALALAERDRFN